MGSRDCIYHASNAKERTIIRDKQVNQLMAFANGQGKNISDTYIDLSLAQGQKTEYRRFLQTAAKYASVVIKGLFFINKWTTKAISDVSIINEKGCAVLTFDTGQISVLPADELLLSERKKVLLYHSKVQKADELKIDTVLDIMKLYVKEHTNWEITGVVIDEADRKSVLSQPNLWEMDVTGFDLVVVQSCSKIDLTSIRFERWCRNHPIDIYSLTEGIISWKGGKYHG